MEGCDISSFNDTGLKITEGGIHRHHFKWRNTDRDLHYHYCGKSTSSLYRVTILLVLQNIVFRCFKIQVTCIACTLSEVILSDVYMPIFTGFYWHLFCNQFTVLRSYVCNFMIVCGLNYTVYLSKACIIIHGFFSPCSTHKFPQASVCTLGSVFTNMITTFLLCRNVAFYY